LRYHLRWRVWDRSMPPSNIVVSAWSAPIDHLLSLVFVDKD
jgi:hypothetical protein